jgi:hypothetical protein
MPRILFVRRRLCDHCPLRRHSGVRIDQRRMRRSDDDHRPLITTKRIKQRTMRRCVDQRPVIVLPVDLDDQRADGLEEARRYRLVIDESPCPPVGKLHAAKDDLGVVGDVILPERRSRRVVLGKLKDRNNLPAVAARADKRSVPAPAECERQCIEKDGFPGTSLAGKHGQSLVEGQLELVDKDDVPDRKRAQHAAAPQAVAARRHRRGLIRTLGE